MNLSMAKMYFLCGLGVGKRWEIIGEIGLGMFWGNIGGKNGWDWVRGMGDGFSNFFNS